MQTFHQQQLPKSESQSVERFLTRYEMLKSYRSPQEIQWRELGRYCHPSRNLATTTASTGLAKEQSTSLYDSTAALSADALASGLYGLLTNPAMDWFELDGDDENKIAIEQALTCAFEDRRNGLYAILPDFYRDLVTFGTAILSVEAGMSFERCSLRFAVRALDEMLFATNQAGRIDTAFRTFKLTAEQAVERYGDLAPKRAYKALENDHPDEYINLIHLVCPREDHDLEAFGPRAMAFTSMVLDPIERQMIHKGGYHEFPYLVARWSLASGAGEIYGESPASLALADIRSLNAMVRTNLIAAQKAVDPPLMAVDDNGLRGVKTHPGAIIFGGLDINGKRLLEPMPTAGGAATVNLGLALEEQRRASIREAFHLGLLRELGEQTTQTATEFLGRQEERLRLLAPNLGRIEAELLYPLVRRVANILARAGKAPVWSDNVKIRFLSPLAQAQRAAEAHRLTRSIRALQPFAEAIPGVMDKLDSDQLSQDLLNFAGLPTRQEEKNNA